MKLLQAGQMLSAVVLCTAMLAGGPATSAMAQSPTAVLPLGDSITQANDSHHSYRYALWKKLVDHGLPTDLVGSMDTNFGGNPQWPLHAGQTFDAHHEGHWGWEAEEILAGRPGDGDLATWLSGYTADIVLMHLGTNDVLRGRAIPDIVTDLELIIDLLQANNPEVVVLLARLIPTTDALGGALPALNQEMDGIATRKTMASSPVVVVDQHSGFNTATDLYDPWHPNAAGEEKMAVKWFQVLQAGPLARLDLMASADGVTFSWTAPAGADGFHVSKGNMAALWDGDGDGVADEGYGACVISLAADEPAAYQDTAIPEAGESFFYLVEVQSFNTTWGQGRSSSNRIRHPHQNCP